MIVDFSTVEVFNKNGPESIPRNLLYVDVVPVSEGINVLVDEIQSASLVSLVEFIDFGPANWSVP